MADNLEWTEQHPVSHIQWLPIDLIHGNDYNPNKVAPPEMKLLELSIQSDGYTQPIVVWQVDGGYEVVDGFHRHLVGAKLGLTHLPCVVINQDRANRADRIASTIRHNRARGKHIVAGMSDIVLELKRRNWSDEKIGRELGMEPDEVLRLAQITGLAEMFADREFSEAWEADDVFKQGKD
jgi:ParB-like chromosome segregation protein Spo0J